MSGKKGIWQYISKRGDSRNWQFVKRYPSDLEATWGKFDRQSLKTDDDAIAEQRAREALKLHDAKVAAARGGKPIFDLSDLNFIHQIPDNARFVIENLSNISQIILPDAVVKGLGDASADQYINMFLELKKDDLRSRFHGELRRAGIIIQSDSALFNVLYEQYHQDKLKTLASFERIRRVSEASNIPTEDLLAFENRVFEQPPDKKKPAPSISITSLWERFKTNNLSEKSKESDKRHIEEIGRRQKYVNAFVDFLGSDLPANHVESTQVIDFFNALQKIPSRKNAKERKMTFTQLIASDHGRACITKAAAIEWWSRLNLIFAYGEIELKKFGYTNPFFQTKKFVKGAKGTTKRTWYAEEIEALFSQPEFTDPSKRDSFYYSTLCALTHGNRMSEFHMRPMSQLKRTPKGTWYIDIEEAKNENSIRCVPLSATVIKAGFLEWVETNRQAGAAYLFPNENHTDPDSRTFSREFGKYLKRRNLYEKTRTFHNFRDSFLTFGYESQLPTDIVDPKMVLRRIAGHAAQDVHESYIYSFIETMKRVVDSVVIQGLPYHQFDG